MTEPSIIQNIFSITRQASNGTPVVIQQNSTVGNTVTQVPGYTGPFPDYWWVAGYRHDGLRNSLGNDALGVHFAFGRWNTTLNTNVSLVADSKSLSDVDLGLYKIGGSSSKETKFVVPNYRPKQFNSTNSGLRSEQIINDIDIKHIFIRYELNTYDTQSRFIQVDTHDSQSGLYYTGPVGPYTFNHVNHSGSKELVWAAGKTGSLPVSLIWLDFETGNAPRERNLFKTEIISASGAGTWTKPTGVTEVIVECWGAGGAGGGVSVQGPAGGGGGGGGSYARSKLTYGSTQQSISYSVGAGGIGTNGTGQTGGDTTWNTNQVVAKGGTGGGAGVRNTGGGDSGLGGTVQAGSVGDVVYLGEDGVGGSVSTVFILDAAGGVGGSGAASFQTALLGTFDVNVGNTELGSPGGPNGNSGDTTPSPGFQPKYKSALQAGGGGGGGAIYDGGTDAIGGNGGNGLIRISYRVDEVVNYTVYSGSYNNKFTIPSGSIFGTGTNSIQSISTVGVPELFTVDIKEIAIFTNSLSVESGEAFRREILTRWPFLDGAFSGSVI